jgi:DNA-binding transcriptional regulator YiaG
MEVEQIIQAAQDRIRNRRALPPPALRRQIREAAGLSRSELAEALNTKTTNVVAYELGRRSPRPELLARYVEILKRLSAL